MVTEIELPLSDGRTLHVYDTADQMPQSRLTVFWHHGTPNTGAPPEPLFAAAAERGIRWVSHDRPGYGTSTPLPGRSVASVAADVTAIADALGMEEFAVMGHSGGGPHALACAAMKPDRVRAAVCVSGLAPRSAAGLDWYAGMVPSGIAELSASVAGRSVLEEHLAATDFDPDQFTASDEAALDGPWAWLGRIAGEAIRDGLGGMVDDELAAVGTWGFEPEAVTRPVLIVHGGRDRMVPAAHGRWLGQHLPGAEFWLRPDDGHVSVLSSAVDALDWLVAHA
jgi:pimeloyl-ACP methyl ester carboxylesterase